eukprot:11882030-Alexandrium_andersonii.AAC.1
MRRYQAEHTGRVAPSAQARCLALRGGGWAGVLLGRRVRERSGSAQPLGCPLGLRLGGCSSTGAERGLAD